MTVLLNFFEQLLLLGSLVIFTGYVLWHTTHGTSSKELVLRLMALFAGAMVVIGAQVAGVDFATFSVNELANAHHVSALARIAGAVLPGVVGVVMGWYLTRSLRRDEDIAMRIMGFVAMLAATQFAAIYVVAMGKRGFEVGAAALPNISFIVGIFIYVIFTYDSKQGLPGRRASRSSLKRRPRSGDEAVPSAGANLFQAATDALNRQKSQQQQPPAAADNGTWPDSRP